MEYENLSILIPAFNEEKGIQTTLEELVQVFSKSEIIVINDGSTDQTSVLAKAVCGVKVIDHHRNIGYGGAIKTGIRNANNEYIAWYDADGQHTPEDLRKVVIPVIQNKKDIVIGVRDENSDTQYSRLPGKYIINFVAQIVVQQQIPDLNSGLRCMRKSVIRRYIHLFPDGFSASTTSTLLMMRRGYIIGYEHITAHRRIGKSSVKIFKDGFSTLKLILRILILFDAFNFFTLLAIVQFVPGFLYGLYIALINKMGFPTLASTIMISGILTFFMGIVTDQIVALRQERFEES